MFAPFMVNAWVAGTVVAVVAGVVGFLVVLRGASFLAHAVPHGAFAGAAGAVLIGVDPLVGLAVFAAGGALTISVLGRRARSDVVTALALVLMLGLGALFLSRSSEYSAEVFALLFGQILGVSSGEILPMLVLGAASLIAFTVFFRPMLLSSALPDMAPARGVRPDSMSIVFGLLLACATTTSVPIVGALLMFALLVGPPSAARFVTRRPVAAIGLSVVLALVTVWASIALAYVTDWPVGFFVTAVSAVLYVAGRATAMGMSHRAVRRAPAPAPA
ncbi:metal ABC transporter permease [Amnibacterium kyonggiense]